MRRILAAAITFAAITVSSGAFAQTSPPAMWGYDWTGPYAGINGGWGTNDTHWRYNTAPFSVVHPDGSGGLVGGTIGYNWQFDPHWLAGPEVDLDWADIGGRTACPNPAFSCRTNIDAFGSFRARAGYVWDRLLIFGTAGGAVSGVDSRTVFLPGGAIPPSNTPLNGQTHAELGWTAGGGIEYALWSRLSVKAEALYYDFGNSNFVVDSGLSARTSEHGILARVGLNWNFGAPPPAPPPMVAPAAAPAPMPPPMARTFLVFFDFDRYNLTPDARRVIEAAAGVYKAGGHPRIDVSGYTDLAGTQAYNLRLSKRRADAVALYLEKQGVPRHAMDVKWFGKEHPRVPTPDGVREPQNRRVEIVMP